MKAGDKVYIWICARRSRIKSAVKFLCTRIFYCYRYYRALFNISSPLCDELTSSLIPPYDPKQNPYRFIINVVVIGIIVIALVYVQ